MRGRQDWVTAQLNCDMNDAEGEDTSANAKMGVSVARQPVCGPKGGHIRDNCTPIVDITIPKEFFDCGTVYINNKELRMEKGQVWFKKG